MTNNVNITQGSGTVIATDNTGGANYQQVKMQWGTLGTITDVDAAHPLPVAGFVPSVPSSSAYPHTSSTAAYAFGQLWGNSTSTTGGVTFGTISPAKANNQAFVITGGLLKKSSTGTTNAIFRVHLFNAVPTTTVGDQGTFAGGITMANWIGSLDFTINQQGSDVSQGLGAPTIGTVICNIPVSGAQTIYWVPEVRGAYAPVASESLTLTLFVQ